MQEVAFVWLNGKILPWKDATIHFLTHGLHYGTAVFEGIRCYKTGKGPAVFRLDDHVRRLFDSAKIIGMKELPFSEREIAEAIMELIRKNNLEECYIRPMFFYGYGKMGLDTVGAKIEAGIAVWPWGSYLGEEGVKNGIRAVVSSISRHYPNSMFVHAKVTGAYVNSMLAKMSALNAGYNEAIMLDTEGFVAECSGENIFLFSNGELLTPEKNSILAGITRDSIIKLAKKEGLAVVEERIARDQLYVADECFIAGTAAEITPVREIDDRAIGKGKPGPITIKLQNAYNDAVHGTTKHFNEWLQFVKR